MPRTDDLGALRVTLNFRQIFSLARYYRMFHRYVGHRILWLSLNATLTTLTEGVGIAVFLSYIQWLGAPGERPPAVIAWLQTQLQEIGFEPSVLSVMGVLLSLFVLRGALLLLQTTIHFRLVGQMQQRLQERNLLAISSLDYLRFLSRDTGTMVHLATKEAERTVTAFYQLAFILPRFVIIAIYAALSFRFEWRFTLLAIAMGSILVLIYRGVTSASESLARQLSGVESRFKSNLIQWIQAFKYLVATGSVGAVRMRAGKDANELAKLGMRAGFLGGIIPATSESLIVGLLVGGVTLQT